MAVPKKRTSYSKKKIQKNRWFKKVLKHAKRFYQQQFNSLS